MTNNPLQKYFRQPKIFVKLPTKGAFNPPGLIDGDPENLPVYAMTGMDEIIVKTPDALLSGQSTVNIIQSCCPAVSDPWELSNLDVDVLLVAIRIATYGNSMSVTHTCPACQTENDYDISLNTVMDHYASRSFESKMQYQDLTIKVKPLTYRKLSEFQIKNFELQRKMGQIGTITDAEEQQTILADLYKGLSLLQNEIFIESIDSVEVDNKLVTEKEFIREWITNAEKAVYDAIRTQTEKNKSAWAAPIHDVTCANCGAVNKASVDLDQANFFGTA
jgi:hypothetical protein